MKNLFCPNKNCSNHKNPIERFYIKKGYYKTKYNHQNVPRYQCKKCKIKFSSHTFKDTFRQHRPDINANVFKLYNGRTTLKFISKYLGVNPKTVVNKFKWLSDKARRIHEEKLKSGEIKTSYVQFDEMETFEHTKLKPLSIAIAVRWKTREIIDIKVAEMNCKGYTAELSRDLYGWRKDGREKACKTVMESVKKCVKDSITVAFDGKKSYPNITTKVMPEAEIKIYKKKSEKKQFDALFSLNKVCADLRKDLSRLTRRTQITTKKSSRLQRHLDLYIAYNNGYVL